VRPDFPNGFRLAPQGFWVPVTGFTASEGHSRAAMPIAQPAGRYRQETAVSDARACGSIARSPKPGGHFQVRRWPVVEAMKCRTAARRTRRARCKKIHAAARRDAWRWMPHSRFALAPEMAFRKRRDVLRSILSGSACIRPGSV